jgi:hypothetical protein
MNLILKEEKPLDIVDQAALVQNYQQQQIVSASSVEYLNSLETFDRSVYEIIRNFKKRGASWSDIIKKISLSNQDLSKSLQSLLRVKPALIITVGFKDLRYVASEFSSAWMLQTSSNIVGIPPLMWYDVSGQVIQPALEGYASTVMSYILLQPGITFVNMKRIEKVL